jgi:hypothetical protein
MYVSFISTPASTLIHTYIPRVIHRVIHKFIHIVIHLVIQKKIRIHICIHTHTNTATYTLYPWICPQSTKFEGKFFTQTLYAYARKCTRIYPSVFACIYCRAYTFLIQTLYACVCICVSLLMCTNMTGTASTGHRTNSSCTDAQNCSTNACLNSTPSSAIWATARLWCAYATGSA